MLFGTYARLLLETCRLLHAGNQISYAALLALLCVSTFQLHSVRACFRMRTSMWSSCNVPIRIIIINTNPRTLRSASHQHSATDRTCARSVQIYCIIRLSTSHRWHIYVLFRFDPSFDRPTIAPGIPYTFSVDRNYSVQSFEPDWCFFFSDRFARAFAWINSRMWIWIRLIRFHNLGQQ